jgi:hypothetical protein
MNDFSPLVQPYTFSGRNLNSQNTHSHITYSNEPSIYSQFNLKQKDMQRGRSKGNIGGFANFK